MLGRMDTLGDHPVSDRDLELTGSAVRRTLEAVGPDVFRMSSVSAWELVAGTVLQQVEAGAIPQGLAQEEISALQAVASHAGDLDLRSRLDGFFFANPRIREVLESAASHRDPSALEKLERLGSELSAGPSAAGAASGPGPDSGKPVHEPIRRDDIASLAQHFSSGWDKLDLMFYSPLDQLTNHATGVIAEASWLTGVRPAEWPAAEMLVETPGGRVPVHKLYEEALLKSPPPQRDINRPAFLAAARGLLARILESAPVWLQVNTVKSDWLRRYGLPPVRSIGLGRASTDEKISVWCATAMVRRIGAQRWPSWRRRINRRLQAATQKLLPGRSEALTLYSFRHDFIDRAKSTLPPAEVAALAGHSSERTKVHYGRPRSKGSAGAMAPAQASPDEVALVEAHLEARASAGRIAEQSHPDPDCPAGPEGPSPSPSPGGSP